MKPFQKSFHLLTKATAAILAAVLAVNTANLPVYAANTEINTQTHSLIYGMELQTQNMEYNPIINLSEIDTDTIPTGTYPLTFSESDNVTYYSIAGATPIAYNGTATLTGEISKGYDWRIIVFESGTYEIHLENVTITNTSTDDGDCCVFFSDNTNAIINLSGTNKFSVRGNPEIRIDGSSCLTIQGDDSDDSLNAGFRFYDDGILNIKDCTLNGTIESGYLNETGILEGLESININNATYMGICNAQTINVNNSILQNDGINENIVFANNLNIRNSTINISTLLSLDTLNISGSSIVVDNFISNTLTGSSKNIITANTFSGLDLSDLENPTSTDTDTLNFDGVIYNPTDDAAIVYGDAILSSELTISKTGTMTIPKGSSLTMEADAHLYNNGSITNNGTLNTSAGILNEGSLSNNGTLNSSLWFFNGGSIDNNGTLSNSNEFLNEGSITNHGKLLYLDEIPGVEGNPVKMLKTISISMGGHMHVSDNNTLTQDIYTGDAMDTVIITADDGYYFSENYTDYVSVTEDSGIVVVRDKAHKLIVSGTLAEDFKEDVTVLLPAATEKEKGYTVEDTNKYYLYFNDSSDTIDLKEYLPDNCGSVSYEEPVINEAIDYTTLPHINSDGLLSYTVKKTANEGNTGTITINVITDYYDDFTITIFLNQVKQFPVTLDKNSDITVKNDTITYGTLLSEVKLNSAVFIDNAGNPVSGTLSWKEPSQKPDVKTTNAVWIFTPTDTNYMTCEGSVDITVNKALNAPNMPQKNITVPFDTKTVGTVSLPENWEWQKSDRETLLSDNVTTACAIYTGEDKGNYEHETLMITITKLSPTPTTSPTLSTSPTMTIAPTVSTSPMLTSTPTVSTSPTLTSTPTVSTSPTLTGSPSVSTAPTVTNSPTVANKLTSYHISYVLNKGKNNKSNPSSYSDKNVILKAPKRAGYSFEGWYLDSNFRTAVTTIMATQQKDITVYAKWKKVKKPAKAVIKSVKNQKGKKLKITLKKKVKNANGYQLLYSTNKKFKKSVKKMTFTKKSISLSKLKKNKTYYVKVRAYKVDSAGKKIYGAYSKVKKVKIKK